jgi:hypothetical protein
MNPAPWSTNTMARKLKRKAMSLAALQSGALFLAAFSAFAAPPGRLQLQLRAQIQVQAPAQHLDLRAPSHALDAGEMEKSPVAGFPSMVHRQNHAHEQAELPSLGMDGIHARPTVQEFVHKVRREGLPVARLFETKSALVHLGLSPRGKPGLWLVQKTH